MRALTPSYNTTSSALRMLGESKPADSRWAARVRSRHIPRVETLLAFYFATAHRRVVIIMIRKAGKLPPGDDSGGGTLLGTDYDLEYGKARLKLDSDILDSAGPDANVLVVGNLVATGGSATASCSLLGEAGTVVHEVACVIERTGKLQPRRRIGADGCAGLHSLLASKYEETSWLRSRSAMLHRVACAAPLQTPPMAPKGSDIRLHFPPRPHQHAAACGCARVALHMCGCRAHAPTALLNRIPRDYV